MRCWSCHEPVEGPVCVGCGAIQPPVPNPDPFVLLGLPRRYHLRAEAVEDAYRSLARKVHPDRFAARPAVERRMALQWTAALNEARRVLKNEQRRAWWLATGSPVPRETGGPRLDPAFLEQIFAWREEEEGEPGALKERAHAAERELLDELGRIFTAWEAGRGDLSGVEDRLVRLKYVSGLARESEGGEHRD